MDKQEIIEEISRTAKSNKGKALGRQRFESETGIKMSDWYPHFWLRWGDALKEAGFTPNQLSTAISSDAAIEKLICLIRQRHQNLRVCGSSSRRQQQSFSCRQIYQTLHDLEMWNLPLL